MDAHLEADCAREEAAHQPVHHALHLPVPSLTSERAAPPPVHTTPACHLLVPRCVRGVLAREAEAGEERAEDLGRARILGWWGRREEEESGVRGEEVGGRIS